MRFLPVAVLFLLICGVGANAVESNSGLIGISLNEPFTLAVDQSAQLDRGDLNITLLDIVENSLCPEGAHCIWEGAIVILLNVKEGTQEDEYRLADRRGHDFYNDIPRTVSTDHYKIHFLGFENNAASLKVAEYTDNSEKSISIIDSQLTLKEAMIGLDPNCPPIIKDNQRLIDVDYYSTDGLVHKGQILVDRRLANDVIEVFQAAFESHFPFESVIPISRFDWSDEDSMAYNNTSAFNYREVTGGKKLSNHAYGFAVDINPALNPYIKDDVMLPAGSAYDPDEPGTLDEDHIIVKKFLELGWEWGGHWKTLKDYQHFEKIPEKK